MQALLKSARRWSAYILTVIVFLVIVTPFSAVAGGVGAGTIVMTAFLRNIWRKLTGAAAVEELPKYDFGSTLEDFGYHFNEKGELVDKDGGRFKFVVREDDRNYNQQHYEALGEAVTDYLNEKMETDLKLIRVTVPVDAKKEEPQGYIFRSEDALQNENLMVLIHGSGAVRAGQWTRKLIINENIDTGSQFPYIRRAMADGFGVIVMNTNLNEAVINGKAREIRGNASPKDHGVYVWENFVHKAEAKNIVIVAHSFGGIVTCTIAEKFVEDFKNRVFSIVYTDSVHVADRTLWSAAVKDFMKQRAVNFASAYVPLNCMMESSHPDDCLSVSAGTEEHERTSHSCIDSAFQFIRDNHATWLKDRSMAPHKFLPLPENLSDYGPKKRWNRMTAKAEAAEPKTDDQKPELAREAGEEEEGDAGKAKEEPAAKNGGESGEAEVVAETRTAPEGPGKEDAVTEGKSEDQSEEQKAGLQEERKTEEQQEAGEVEAEKAQGEMKTEVGQEEMKAEVGQEEMKAEVGQGEMKEVGQEEMKTAVTQDEVKGDAKEEEQKEKIKPEEENTAVKLEEPESSQAERNARQEEPDVKQDAVKQEVKQEEVKPAIKEEEPELKQEEPELKQEEPESKQEEPELKQEEPELKQEEPELKQEEPELKQEEPELKQEEPELKQEEPELKQEKPELKQEVVTPEVKEGELNTEEMKIEDSRDTPKAEEGGKADKEGENNSSMQWEEGKECTQEESKAEAKQEAKKEEAKEEL